MSKVVTTEVIEEPIVQAPEASKETEIQAEAAEASKSQAEASKEESKEAAEEAKEAAKDAQEESEKAKKSTSYNEYALKGLMDSVQLVVTRMEQVMGIVKEMQQTFQEVNEELRMTTELHQDQIGQVDEAASKIVTATAALVKLHKEMNQAD